MLTDIVIPKEIQDVINCHPYLHSPLEQVLTNEWEGSFGPFINKTIHLGYKQACTINIRFSMPDKGTIYLHATEYPLETHAMIGIKDKDVSISIDSNGIYQYSLIQNSPSLTISLFIAIDYICYKVLMEDVKHSKENHLAYSWTLVDENCDS